jgi:hypothetical protein
MAGKLPYGLFENKIIDEADQAELFDRRNKIASGDDAPLRIAHSQQAFKIIDPAGRRTDYGLESKQQAILAQRVLHSRAYCQMSCLPFRLDFFAALAHPYLPGSLSPHSVPMTARRDSMVPGTQAAVAIC